MGIILNARYKLTKHPHQPTGTICRINPYTREIDIEWDDKTLIPPIQKYPQDALSDGTFEFLNYGGDFSGYLGEYVPECAHEWVRYTGLMNEYEYCKKCDVKKEQV